MSRQYICTIGGTDDDNGLVVPRLGISAPLQSERDTRDCPCHQNGADKVYLLQEVTRRPLRGIESEGWG